MRTRHRTLVGLAMGLAVALPSRTSAAENVWTIPGTVNAAGLNGTRFVSDLAVTNPGTAPVQLTFSLVPAGSTSPKQVSLNAGGTVVYRDLLTSLWGTQGAGATQVSSAGRLLIRARTYNAAASGTYGVALPVFTDDRLLSRGESADSFWISQSESGDSGYRTNIAVVFPDAGGGAATVTIYDGAGKTLGSTAFSLDAAGFQQFGVGSFAGVVPVGRAKILVTRGRAAGYSVVVDNLTGDSSLFTFEDLPEGYQDVLVNGVARANGKNDTFFRTDGRFYNPAATDATVTVAFHENKASNPSPVKRDLVVPAGRTLDVVDLLDSLLALPVGSAGALRFTTASPVAILCRTSNVDPSGAKPGTFGAQQKPTPLLAFLMSADPGAVVTGIRQNTAFRTNVGFAAGKEGAAYTLTLKSKAGETVATTTASLGAFGWTQPGVESLFPGTTIPEDAALIVKVSSGSVDVFDSSIDNASGDPVVTPIMPLPAEPPSSATLGPGGGSIRSDDGRLTLKVPAGALSSSVALSLVTIGNGVPLGQGSGYRLSPGGLSFAVPSQLVFAYGSGDVKGAGSGSLGLAFASGGEWYVATGGAVTPSRRTLTVPISSTTPVSTPAAVRAGRALAAPADQDWAPFLARRLDPVIKAIPEGGKVEFAIVALSHSSSDGSFIENLALGKPVTPKDIVYTWFVDGTLGGSDSVGTIAPSQNLAQYTAPRCVPSDNPLVVSVGLLNPAGAPLLGGVAFFALEATVRILPRHWTIEADFFQYENCEGSRTVARREDWNGAKIDFTLDDLLNIVVDEDLLYLPVKGKPTAFAGCPGMGCDFKEDPVDELQLTSVTGNYGEAYDYLTYLVKMGDGKPRLFPGYTYLACPCDGGCKATVDPYGSPLVPYFGTTKVVPEDFVLKYEYFDLSPAEGFSTKATISGVPCK